MRRAAALIAAFAVAGCGGESDDTRVTRTEASPPASGERVLVAAVGDSITAGYPLWDPSPELRRQLGVEPDRRSQYQYWAQRKLGRRVRFRNCGQSGARTDEIRSLVEDCARGAQVLIVQGGVNDLVQGRLVATIARNLRAMVRSGKRLGLRVAVAELLPVRGAPPDFVTKIAALNDHIRRDARAERVAVIRWHAVLADPRDAGEMSARFTTDGVHPTIDGYRRLGESISLP